MQCLLSEDLKTACCVIVHSVLITKTLTTHPFHLFGKKSTNFFNKDIVLEQNLVPRTMKFAPTTEITVQ